MRRRRPKKEEEEPTRSQEIRRRGWAPSSSKEKEEDLVSALCFQREKEEDQKRLHSRRKKREEEHQRLWSPKILLQSVTPSRVPPTPSIATATRGKNPPFLRSNCCDDRSSTTTVGEKGAGGVVREVGAPVRTPPAASSPSLEITPAW